MSKHFLFKAQNDCINEKSVWYLATADRSRVLTVRQSDTEMLWALIICTSKRSIAYIAYTVADFATKVSEIFSSVSKRINGYSSHKKSVEWTQKINSWTQTSEQWLHCIRFWSRLVSAPIARHSSTDRNRNPSFVFKQSIASLCQSLSVFCQSIRKLFSLRNRWLRTVQWPVVWALDVRLAQTFCIESNISWFQ